MKTLAICLALVLSSPSFASNIPTSSQVNLCTLHYSKAAYGKEVRSVMSHTGLTSCPTYSTAPWYWLNVQDVMLDGSQPGDAFTGKVRLEGSGHAYDGCTLTPVVQFWVNFADGSSKIENIAVMQTTSRWNELTADPAKAPMEAKDAIAEWSRNQAINTVACITLSGYVGEPEKLVNEILK